ncbi:hypothetical protein AVEN_85915-1, partial [Araneus ventricosus]
NDDFFGTGSDTTYKINEDKETDGVASDEDSSSIEDSNIAPSDGVASDEDSSSNEDPNIARSVSTVTEFSENKEVYSDKLLPL